MSVDIKEKRSREGDNKEEDRMPRSRSPVCNLLLSDGLIHGSGAVGVDLVLGGFRDSVVELVEKTTPERH